MANMQNGFVAEAEIAGVAYRVGNARIDEGISEIPTCALELTTLDKSDLPAPESLLRTELKFTLTNLDGGDPHTFRGIVIDAGRTARVDGDSLTVVAAPKLWLLTKRQDSRIFQDVSVVDVVTDVLTQAGVTSVEKRLTGTYPPRTYVTQYRETDLEFVLRLLCEEGIYLVHDFKDDEKLVLADDPKGTDDSADKEMKYYPRMGFDAPPRSITAVSLSHRVRTDKVFVRDYDFERPRLELEATVEGKDKGAHALEVYLYPGRFVDQGVGKRYAQVLLDSMQAQRQVASGESNSIALAPGLRFSVADHPYNAVNQEYLVTHVQTTFQERGGARDASGVDLGGGGVKFSTKWTGMATANADYRPPRRPRPAKVPSVQSAVTTGPSGQEIYTDKHGRVKVHFPWNRAGKPDQTSSMWMRTSQLPTGGSMLLPRVGWEVLVQANESDIDHPLVMSRLYNAQKPPPYALPANKTRGSIQTATTPGGGSTNEIRTDDTAGSEEMFINASKDASIKVNNNTTEMVKVNETRTIGSNQTIEITNSSELTVGASQTLDVGGNQDVHVSTYFVEDMGGDHTLTIAGNRDLKIGGDHKITVASNSTLTVGSMCTDLVVGKVCEQVGGNYKLDVGAVRAAITPANHSLQVTGNHTEKMGLLKVTITFGGKSVSVGGDWMAKVGGAIIGLSGSHSEKAGGNYTGIAAGAQIVKCENATFEAESVLTVVMGASLMIMTPANVSFLGLSVKMDGETDQTAALIVDNI
ncbi:MAG: type VI secretion system tip protein TssI/VgrG [Polyangiaceae bacterium]